MKMNENERERIKATPHPMRMLNTCAACDTNCKKDHRTPFEHFHRFLRILYGFFSYRIQPFGCRNILLWIYYEETHGRCKTTEITMWIWCQNVVSFRFAHLIQWASKRCDNNTAEHFYSQRPSKLTTFIRLYGFCVLLSIKFRLKNSFDSRLR